ncbi:hypothetical protein J6590_078152 [Homalodisca vitripennis]|nr:hypothetical protein J6590_078152 [Homalodisca vitripennis]
MWDYTDNAAKWIAKYETDDFENVIAKLMKKIRPLFKQLHAYVRRKLWLYYGKDSTIIDLKGPIPASLLVTRFQAGTVINAPRSVRSRETTPRQDLIMCKNYHKSQHAQKWFDDLDIRVMIWPPRSPNLNPIENLSNTMEVYVSADLAVFR